MIKPIPCGHCGEVPVGIACISVHYNSPRKQGIQPMMRVACQCGAIGKCRPDAQSAIEAWNEPWQALVVGTVMRKICFNTYALASAFCFGWAFRSAVVVFWRW